MALAEAELIARALGEAGVVGVDRADDLQVVALVAAADIVGFADPAVAQDQFDAKAVILHMQPIAHIHAVAIDRQAAARQRVEREERLLDGQ